MPLYEILWDFLRSIINVDMINPYFRICSFNPHIEARIMFALELPIFIWPKYYLMYSLVRYDDPSNLMNEFSA